MDDPAGQPPPISAVDGLVDTSFSVGARSPIAAGAGFGIRALARCIDLLYGILLGLVVGVFSGVIFALLSHFGRLSPDWTAALQERSFFGFGFGIMGAFLYHASAEAIGSVTIGKAICGLRVLRLDGDPIDTDAALKRDLAYHWDALFFGLVAYAVMDKSPLRQRYGDRWGETVVVKADKVIPGQGRSSIRMTVGILIGSLLWGSMQFLQLLLKVL